MEYPRTIDDIKNNLQKIDLTESDRRNSYLKLEERKPQDAQNLLTIAFNLNLREKTPQNQKRTSNRDLMRMVLKGKFDQPDSQTN